MTQSIGIGFLDRSLSVAAPESIAGDVAGFFALAPADKDSGAAQHEVVIREDAPGRFAIDRDGVPIAADLRRGDVLDRLAALAGRDGAPAGRDIPLAAAAVAWEGKAVLIVGDPGSGKSSLAAWFVEQGFAYVADTDVRLLDDAATIAGFAGPLSFRAGAIDHIGTLSSFHAAASVVGGADRLLIRPDLAWQASDRTLPCGLVVVLDHRPGAVLALDAAAEDEARQRIAEAVRSPGGARDDDPRLTGLARQVPVVRLTYGDFGQIAGVLDFLARAVLAAEPTPDECRRFLAGLPRSAPTTTRTYPVPERTERTLAPRLTIGMATYDDYDGVFFTIQAIRMYHPEVVDDVEFLVVDNHPDGPCGAPLKALETAIPNYRYLPLAGRSGTATTRDLVFREAAGDFVLCMDCHVFIVAGALRRLLAYFRAHPDSADLLQGPLVSESLQTLSTHFDPVWREGMYGVWAHDPAGRDEDAPPFDIPMQGLGVFACRRTAWPGFNPLFRGFGGEEGYIHEKVRQAGGRTLCLPFLRWMHRFKRPMGTPYPNIWEDRIRNYFIGWQELGLSTEAMEAHFGQHLGAEVAARIFTTIRSELEMLNARPAPPLPSQSRPADD